jgi:hypothetical protein
MVLALRLRIGRIEVDIQPGLRNVCTRQYSQRCQHFSFAYSNSEPHHPYPEQHWFPEHRDPEKSAPQRPTAWRASKWLRKRVTRFREVTFCISNSSGAAFRDSEAATRLALCPAFGS